MSRSRGRGGYRVICRQRVTTGLGKTEQERRVTTASLKNSQGALPTAKRNENISIAAKDKSISTLLGASQTFFRDCRGADRRKLPTLSIELNM